MPVSLILTVLNEEKTILPLLDSISHQTKLPNEIIIADAGSTDDTIEIIKQFQKNHPTSKIKLYETPNANRSQGRNLAIKKAKHPIIAVTDAGCIHHPDWLNEITKPLKSSLSKLNEKLETNNSKLISIVAGAYQPITDTLWQRAPASTACDAPPGASSRSIAFRKAAWQTIGGYPENLNTAEDLIFNKRLLKAGFIQTFAPQAIVDWYPPKSTPKIIKQFFNYSQGDGLAGLESPQTKKHLIKTFLLLLLLTLLLNGTFSLTGIISFLFITIFLQAFKKAFSDYQLQYSGFVRGLYVWAHFLWSLILIPTTLIGFWSGFLQRIISKTLLA